MRRFAILISLLVFVTGAGIFVASALSKRSIPAKPFVVTYKVTRLNVGEQPVTEELQTEFVKPTGEWKVTRYFLQENLATVRVGTKDAVYDIGANSLNFVSLPRPADLHEHFRSAEFLKSHPAFTRMDNVAGFTAYVHHASDSSGFWVEMYYATETGITSLKTVMHDVDGSELVIEAINVQFRDATDLEINPPDLPVSFSKAEQQVQEYRARGETQSADALSKTIEDVKQKHLNSSK